MMVTSSVRWSPMGKSLIGPGHFHWWKCVIPCVSRWRESTIWCCSVGGVCIQYYRSESHSCQPRTQIPSLPKEQWHGNYSWCGSYSVLFLPSFELGRARSHHYHCTLDKGRGSLEDMESVWDCCSMFQGNGLKFSVKDSFQGNNAWFMYDNSHHRDYHLQIWMFHIHRIRWNHCRNGSRLRKKSYVFLQVKTPWMQCLSFNKSVGCRLSITSYTWEVGNVYW